MVRSEEVNHLDGGREPRGNPAERLVREHYGDVYRLALRLLADREAAADLTQEVFYRAIRALPRFREESNLRTWLYRITVNESRRPAFRETATGEIPELPDPADGPEAETIRRFDSRRLHGLVAALPHPYREAVVLYYLQGIRMDECGRILGVTGNTMKTWLFRARKRLRDQWEGEE